MEAIVDPSMGEYAVPLMMAIMHVFSFPEKRKFLWHRLDLSTLFESFSDIDLLRNGGSGSTGNWKNGNKSSIEDRVGASMNAITVAMRR